MRREDESMYGIGDEVWPGMAKVIEEMGELQTVMAKIMSCSGGVEYWDGTDLFEKLMEELADVEAALWFFELINEKVRWRRDQLYLRRVRQKQDQYLQWHMKNRETHG
jgi:isocitrate/isopropylmalate dehydrogenase